jgi:hypothetical protein
MRRAEFSTSTNDFTGRFSLNDLTPHEEVAIFKAIYNRMNVNSFLANDDDSERITNLIDDAIISYTRGSKS